MLQGSILQEVRVFDDVLVGPVVFVFEGEHELVLVRCCLLLATGAVSLAAHASVTPVGIWVAYEVSLRALALCLDHTIVPLVVLLLHDHVEFPLLDQLLLVLRWQLGVDNGALNQAVHLHGTLLVRHAVILAPGLVPKEGFESHDLILHHHLQYKSLDGQRKLLGWFGYGQFAKLRQVKINGFDVVSVFPIHLVHQVFYQIGPLNGIQVLEDHVHVEQRRLKHVQQWAIPLLVEGYLAHHHLFLAWCWLDVLVSEFVAAVDRQMLTLL